MTHVELIERVLADYEKSWEENPAKDSEFSTKKDVENFREGMRYAYRYLLTVLMNGDEWIYED